MNVALSNKSVTQPTAPAPADPHPEPVKNELGQTVVPPGGKPAARTSNAPVPQPPQSEFQSRADEYLVGNGWEKIGTNPFGDGIWRDPMSAGDGRGVRTQVGELARPNSPGTKDPLYQVVCPPCRWDRATADAMAVQSSRDEAAKPDDDATPLERVDRLEARISEQLGQNVKTAQEMESLLRRAIPEKPDNMRAEIVVLRRALAAAAGKLKGGA